MTCMSGSPEDCDSSVPDCAGIADYYCCMTEDVDGCNDNALLLEFISELVVMSCNTVCYDSDDAGQNKFLWVLAGFAVW